MCSFPCFNKIWELSNDLNVHFLNVQRKSENYLQDKKYFLIYVLRVKVKPYFNSFYCNNTETIFSKFDETIIF